MIEKIHNAHVRKLCTLAQNDAQTLQYRCLTKSSASMLSNP